MLTILEKHLKKESQFFEHWDCEFSFDNPIIIDDLEISQYNDDNHYSISLQSLDSDTLLYSLLNSSFESFLIENGKYVDYEILLPFNIQTSCDLFDSLTTILFICKIGGKHFIKMQIAQDFEIDSLVWGKYSPFYLHDKLVELGTKNRFEKIEFLEGEDDTEERVRLVFNFNSDENINEALKNCIKKLPLIENELQKTINSDIWLDSYSENEEQFSKEIVFPLLRKMKYSNVRYNHGKKEYGRDFIFSDINRFGESEYYGMQVKAGDISGQANSYIDLLIGQLTDAFTMPFYKLGDSNQYFIHTFIFAISGNFTENAREKIAQKIPKGLLGAVYFWDKNKIFELIENNWNK